MSAIEISYPSIRVTAPRLRPVRSSPVRSRPVLVMVAKSIGYVMVLALVLVLAARAGLALGGSGMAGVDVDTVQTYIVQPGDSLWSIAQKSDSSAAQSLVIEQIRSLNSLHSDHLQVGQALVVPMK